MADPELLTQIRQVLADSPFVGEGHRKVWARLRRRGVCTSRKRALRLTREAGLLAPTARVRRRARRLHEGTITVTKGGAVNPTFRKIHRRLKKLADGGLLQPVSATTSK